MDQFEIATQRAQRRQLNQPTARSARYDRERDRVVVELDTGSEFAFPRSQAQGLEQAHPSDLAVIEITPSGFGLHFPKLDADLWLPALLQGIFGSASWMAAQLGARGGMVRSNAKTRAARANGKLGGRPKKAKSRSSQKPSRAQLSRAIKKAAAPRGRK